MQQSITPCVVRLNFIVPLPDLRECKFWIPLASTPIRFCSIDPTTRASHDIIEPYMRSWTPHLWPTADAAGLSGLADCVWKQVAKSCNKLRLQPFGFLIGIAGEPFFASWLRFKDAQTGCRQRVGTRDLHGSTKFEQCSALCLWWREGPG